MLLEVQQKQNQIRQNILKGFSNEIQPTKVNTDNLIKGEILNQFGYSYGSGKQLTFNKTGAWLKESLPLVVLRLTTLKTDIEAKMVTLVASIGEEPTETDTSYNMKSVKVMRYPYEKMYVQKNIGSLNYVSDTTEDDECCKLCRQYNELAYALKSCLEDIACCNVIIENVEDKQKYEFTVSQLAALASIDAIQKGEIDMEEGNEDSLFKAEGSRGGKVVGHTKSGKPIYEGTSHVKTNTSIGKTQSGKSVYHDKAANHKDYKDFSDQDHIDAYHLHGNIGANGASSERKKIYGTQSKQSSIDTREHHNKTSGDHWSEATKDMKEGDKKTFTHADDKNLKSHWTKKERGSFSRNQTRDNE